MLYFAQRDNCNFVVCSVVEGVTPSYLVPVAYVPVYDGSGADKPLRFLKAGVVSEEQANLPWALLDNGIALNPIALERLQHFNALHVMQNKVQHRGIRYNIITKGNASDVLPKWNLSPVMTSQSTPAKSKKSEIQALAKDFIISHDQKLSGKMFQLWCDTMLDHKHELNQKYLIQIVSNTKVIQRAFKAFQSVCVVYRNICEGFRILKSRQRHIHIQLAFTSWSDCFSRYSNETNPTQSDELGASLDTDQPALDHSDLQPVKLFNTKENDSIEPAVMGKQQDVTAIMHQKQDHHIRNQVRNTLRVWYLYVVFHVNVRIITKRILAQKVFWSWRDHFYFKQISAMCQYHTFRKAAEIRVLQQKYFSAWYEQYNTKYDLPRARLEYHFKLRNFRRIAMPVLLSWSEYTDYQPPKKARAWVDQRIRAKLPVILHHWFYTIMIRRKVRVKIFQRVSTEIPSLFHYSSTRTKIYRLNQPTTHDLPLVNTRNAI